MANIQIRDARNGNWAWYDKEVVASPKLTTTEKMVYIALTYFANDSQRLYPSINTICELSGKSRQTVITTLKRLQRLKLIKKEKAKGKVTKYILLKVKGSNHFTTQSNHLTGVVKPLDPNNTYLTRYKNKKGKIIEKLSIPYEIRNEAQVEAAQRERAAKR